MIKEFIYAMRKKIIFVVIVLFVFILWLFYIDSERQQLKGSPFCIDYSDFSTRLYFRVPENDGGMTIVIYEWDIQDIYWTDSCACVSFRDSTARSHYYYVSVIKDEVMPGGIYFSTEGPFPEDDFKELIETKGLDLTKMKYKQPKPRKPLINWP